jgi:hypothetical protein
MVENGTDIGKELSSFIGTVTGCEMNGLVTGCDKRGLSSPQLLYQLWS